MSLRSSIKKYKVNSSINLTNQILKSKLENLIKLTVKRKIPLAYRKKVNDRIKSMIYSLNLSNLNKLNKMNIKLPANIRQRLNAQRQYRGNYNIKENRNSYDKNKKILNSKLLWLFRPQLYNKLSNKFHYRYNNIRKKEFLHTYRKFGPLNFVKLTNDINANSFTLNKFKIDDIAVQVNNGGPKKHYYNIINFQKYFGVPWHLKPNQIISEKPHLYSGKPITRKQVKIILFVA